MHMEKYAYRKPSLDTLVSKPVLRTKYSKTSRISQQNAIAFCCEIGVT